MEDALTGISKKVIEGNLPKVDGKAVLLTEGIATYLGLHTGDTLIILGQGYHGAMAAGKFPIEGIVQFASPELNDQMAYLPLKAAQYLFAADDRLTSLSLQLAKKLNVKLRSKVVLTLQDAGRNIVSGAYRIAGIFKTNNNIYDEGNIFIRNSDLQKMLGIGDGIHEIAVVLRQNEQLDTLLSKYRATNPNLLFESWKELMPEIQFMIDAFQQMMEIILFIILLTLGFGLVNIMLMAVLERVREIGILMAIGMNKLKIFWMIMLETFFLSLVGGPAGILLGYLTVQLLGHSGINLSFYAEGLSTFGYGNLVYPLKFNAKGSLKRLLLFFEPIPQIYSPASGNNFTIPLLEALHIPRSVISPDTRWAGVTSKA